ncbi:MAG: hypothetical protein HRU38_16780 [Saccharospirillaceae bacterium]|nr:hypothetical protein [Pseudomonadales bacterium]NRB80292.1 hypothetical protein [Saccharospirillaceae bacterium]
MEQLASIYSAITVTGVTVFRNGGDVITSNVDFKNAAFSEQNREEGLISEAITSINNTIVLVEIVEYLPEQVKLLDEVNGEIIDILVKQKASEMSIAKAQQLVEMYQDELVADLKLEGFEEAKTVSRNDAALTRVIKTQLFEMSKASEKVSVTKTANGVDQVVIVLTKVTNAEVDQESEAFIAYKQSLDSLAGNAALRSFQTFVIETAEVEGL